MTNRLGKFDYEITKAKSGSNLPFNPRLQFCLKEYGQTTSDGAPTISPSLMTDQEIDEYVKLLKDDLDAVSKNAKKALRKAKIIL